MVDEMWNRGDAAAVEELIHEDMVEHGATGGTGGGREDARRTVAGFRAAFPDLVLEIDDLVGEGEHVVLRWTGRGTHEGAFLGRRRPATAWRSRASTSTASWTAGSPSTGATPTSSSSPASYAPRPPE